ncbi:hypothetical protein L1887_39173 [Cichorium endivia]|nr:hypothetical protein L1887_39173 [Cichorium endivia]
MFLSFSVLCDPNGHAFPIESFQKSTEFSPPGALDNAMLIPSRLPLSCYAGDDPGSGLDGKQVEILKNSQSFSVLCDPNGHAFPIESVQKSTEFSPPGALDNAMLIPSRLPLSCYAGDDPESGLDGKQVEILKNSQMYRWYPEVYDRCSDSRASELGYCLDQKRFEGHESSYLASS